MYARVLQLWVDVDNRTAADAVTPQAVIEGMLEQRRALGATKKLLPDVPKDLQVTPVVVLQKGAPEVRKAQMLAVRDALSKVRGVPNIEIYEVSILGDFDRIA